MCPSLWDPTDYSLQGSSVRGISQERILEWVTSSYSRGSSWPRDQTHISCTGKWAVYHWATWEAPVQHWMMSENTTLRERSLTQKSTKYMVMIIRKLRTSKVTEMSYSSSGVVSRRQADCKGAREDVLEPWTHFTCFEVMVRWIYETVKAKQTKYLRLHYNTWI